MRINDLGSSAFQYGPQVTSRRAATQHFSLESTVSEPTTSAYSPVAASTRSYDTKHIAYEDIWKLKDDLVAAGHAGDLKGVPSVRSMLRLFSMSHPKKISETDVSVTHPPIDLFQRFDGQIEFAKSDNDSSAAADFQSLRNWFQSFADENGVINIPNATAEAATQG